MLEMRRAQARSPKARGPKAFLPARQARGPKPWPEFGPEIIEIRNIQKLVIFHSFFTKLLRLSK